MMRMKLYPRGQKTRYINPPNTLKQKVGGGGLPPKVLEAGQKTLESNKTDFAPYAQTYLKKIKLILKNHDTGKITSREAIEQLSDPVMQLKANGGMFGYPLISEIADIVLLLLDNIEEINEDSLQIVRVHENAIHIIVASKLQGRGGREGSALVAELTKACKRFYDKYSITPQ